TINPGAGLFCHFSISVGLERLLDCPGFHRSQAGYAGANHAPGRNCGVAWGRLASPHRRGFRFDGLAAGSVLLAPALLCARSAGGFGQGVGHNNFITGLWLDQPFMMIDPQLANKVALVTGASSGIGAATARAL